MTTITGSTGNDTLSASSHDLLSAGDGNDTLTLLLGENGVSLGTTVLGEGGDDLIDAARTGEGEQRINIDGALVDGGAGNDWLYVPGYSSTVNGGAGNDTLVGGHVTGMPQAGYGQLNGGDGDDLITVHGTGFTIAGDAGTDIFALTWTPVSFGFTWSSIVDFTAGEDRLDLSALIAQHDELYSTETTNPFADGWLRFQQEGENAVLQVNNFGWTPLLVLRGIDAWAMVNGEHADHLFTTAIDARDPTVGAFRQGTDANDAFTGHDGGDTLNGNGGNDTLVGGGGDDVLEGGFGNDSLVGGAGNDWLFANVGIDMVHGGIGNDTLFGGDGDILSGDDGDDLLHANAVGVTITLLGGAGDDTFSAVGSHIRAWGQQGNDYFFADGDDIQFRGGTGHDSALGCFGRDSLSGDDGNDTLIGRAGDDLVDGGLGNDSLLGREGIDSLYGDAGDDTLHGGGGSDYLFGGLGNDLLQGAAGNDRLYVGIGNDTASGGYGNDRFVFRDTLANVTTITDFASGADALVIRGWLGDFAGGGALTVAEFRAGASAQDADDRIVYDVTTGALYYDADGSGAAVQVQFAQLGTGGVALVAGDILVT